jgi:hypothetical protein
MLILIRVCAVCVLCADTVEHRHCRTQTLSDIFTRNGRLSLRLRHTSAHFVGRTG